MDEKQTETSNATTDESGPDNSEPTPERQAELRKVYEANVAVGKPPYAGVRVDTRGELRWILQERGWTPSMYDTRNEIADFRDSTIRADLSGMELDASDLSRAILIEADFVGASLTFANLSGIVAGGDFSKANLTFANLSEAIFADDTNFAGANFTGANLSGTGFGGNCNLTGANLTRSYLDGRTKIGGDYGETASSRGTVQLDSGTRLLDVFWNGAILALVDWNQMPRLGDELDIKDATNHQQRVRALQNAARAYRGLARELDTQGLTAPALRYRQRQHQLERAAQLRSFNLLGWLFSSALNLVSGYGDRPLRALGVYLAVILAFAGVYFGITTPGSPIFFSGSQPLQLHEAVVFSLSSFHGRGFFPSTIGLGDPVAIVAALEAVVGLFIELVLIATFTRRLFER